MPDRPENPNKSVRPNKPFFSKGTVTVGEVFIAPPCNVVRVYSVAGSLTIKFNDGDAVPATAGDKFKCDWGQRFDKVECEATGGNAVVIFGFGDMDNHGVAGVATLVTSSPEGSLAGVIGALAYNSTDGSFWFKLTGNGTNTGWVIVTA